MWGRPELRSAPSGERFPRRVFGNIWSVDVILNGVKTSCFSVRTVESSEQAAASLSSTRVRYKTRTGDFRLYTRTALNMGLCEAGKDVFLL